MTLKDLIASDALAVFGDTTNGFAYEITQWKRGDSNNTATLIAIVDESDETGVTPSKETRIEDKHGQRVRAEMILEIMTPGAEISATVDPRDKFLLPDGRLVNAVEILGHDIESDTYRLMCIEPGT